MPKRTTIFIVTIFVFLTSLLFSLFVFNDKQKSVTNPKLNLLQIPQQSQKAQTIISFSPNPLYIASQSGALDILVNTGSNKITAVQLEISFDKDQVSDVEIIPGNFFNKPVELINDVNEKNGKISYALAIPPTGNSKTGTGIVARIIFSTKYSTAKKTNFTLLPKTLVTAEGENASVLKSAEGTGVILQK